jgi:uncharacterized protein (TIGR00369 family)
MQPLDPHFADRVRASFARQGAMEAIGARIACVEAGEVEIEIDFVPRLTQQHGFLHGGIVATILDSACGYAAMTLTGAQSEVVAVGYAVSFVAPARGIRVRAIGRVRRAGRRIIFCNGEALAVGDDGRETLVATMQSTIATVEVRAAESAS